MINYTISRLNATIISTAVWSAVTAEKHFQNQYHQQLMHFTQQEFINDKNLKFIISETAMMQTIYHDKCNDIQPAYDSRWSHTDVTDFLSN